MSPATFSKLPSFRSLVRHLNCTCNWAVALTGKNLGNLDTNILYKPCMGFGIHMNLKNPPKNQTKKNHSEYTWIIVFISFSLWDSLRILNYKSCTCPAWDSVWRKHVLQFARPSAECRNNEEVLPDAEGWKQSFIWRHQQPARQGNIWLKFLSCCCSYGLYLLVLITFDSWDAWLASSWD